MTEILITAIRINGPIVKGYTLRGKGFIQPVVLTLEDGREIESTIDNERKKNLSVTLARKEASIKRKAFKASFNDEGKFWGTVETMSFGIDGNADANNVGAGHEEGGVVDDAIHGRGE